MTRNLRFEVVTAMLMMNAAFWEWPPCKLVYSPPRLLGRWRQAPLRLGIYTPIYKETRIFK
jgi:hypothetical protein